MARVVSAGDFLRVANARHRALLSSGQEQVTLIGEWNDLDAYVAEVTDFKTIDEDLEEAMRANRTRLLEPELARSLTRTQHAFCRDSQTWCLEAFVSVEVVALTIPDHSRDEIQVELRIASGADPDHLLRFMSEQGMIAAADVPETRKRWTMSEATIGAFAEEMAAIDKCLAVGPVDCVSEHPGPITYHYGLQSGRIWRSWGTTVVWRTALDLSRYPFDASVLTFTFGGYGNWDVAERVLRPDPDADPSANFSASAWPRGCRITSTMDDLEPFAESPGKDSFPESVLRTGCELRREPGTTLWRTFLPALVILLMGFSAALAVVGFGFSPESTATQVLPAVLIACVALQLTAAQQVPSHSGRTKLDTIFVLIYSQVLALFVALLLATTAGQAGRAWATALVGAAGFGFLWTGASVARALRCSWR
jgi:hypothetical protein